MRMMQKLAAVAVGLSLIITSASAAQKKAGLFDAKNFSNTIYLTTQYVFRGVSFSDRDPAIQGSFDYSHPSGFYAGVWGSNWDGFGTESELELDYYLGYANALGPVDYDLGALYYTFPGAEDIDPTIGNFEQNYFEAHLGLTHTLDAAPLTPTLGVAFNYSPDYNGNDGDGRYILGTVDLALPAGIGLALGVGYLDVAGHVLSGVQNGFSYTHYQVGLSKTILEKFTFDVTYHGTSHDCQSEYGGAVLLDTEDCTPGAVFTISRTF
jgi:uncharacterized protein (TIGR02001 family)